MKYQWAGVLLITSRNQIIAMHRDDKPGIRDPGRYGIFGGAVEPGETAIQAALREIEEETNLKIDEQDLGIFRVYRQERDYLDEPNELHVFVIQGIDPQTLETYEGQGIKVLDNADDKNIAEDIKEAFVDWFAIHTVKPPEDVRI